MTKLHRLVHATSDYLQANSYGRVSASLDAPKDASVRRFVPSFCSLRTYLVIRHSSLFFFLHSSFVVDRTVPLFAAASSFRHGVCGVFARMPSVKSLNGWITFAGCVLAVAVLYW